MDPNEALKKIRELLRKFLDSEAGKANVWSSDGEMEQDTTDLVEHVFNLDQWLSKGGFLPDEWTKVSREQIAKLQRKHTPSRLERTLKGEVVTCGKQADGYFCTKPKDHLDKGDTEHAALADEEGMLPYFTWSDTDPECPVCGRISGHDSFAHGRDGDFD